MRTLKESSVLIEKTIKQIKSTKGNLTDETIERICLKNDISHTLIREIACWKKPKGAMPRKYNKSFKSH